MTNDPQNPAHDSENRDDSISGGETGSDYQPRYSEPTYGTTSSQEDAWDVPSSSEPVADDATSHASAPDATPLTEGQGVGWQGTGPIQGNPSGPGHGQQPPQSTAGYGQPPHQGQASNQQYQAGPPMGGMPPQNYSGGYAPMMTGPTNPNWLAGPTEAGRSTLQLDYWLSVFFSWIPALIFFLTERDKNQLVDEHTKELLNFNITRIIVGAVMIIPVIGTIIGGIASIVLFVMAILGALKGTEEYANGRVYRFPLTFRFIK